jgi:hypothetical protein
MKLKVAVLDMQPITPAVGGGRLRLLGLYHALGDDIDARYVGTYDWPGEPYRRLRLSPTLEEIDVPLSDAHHAAARELAARASGKTVIDVAFHRQCHLSPRYLEEARAAVTWADVVVFSHPWVYPPMQGYLRPGQTVVYDSQNVEGLLRAQLLDESHAVEADLLRGVVEAERGAGGSADLILACSHEDLQLFHHIYGWPLRQDSRGAERRDGRGDHAGHARRAFCRAQHAGHGGQPVGRDLPWQRLCAERRGRTFHHRRTSAGDARGDVRHRWRSWCAR